MNRKSGRIEILFISIFIAFQFSCDRTPQQKPSTTRQIDFVADAMPRFEPVKIELSVESMIDHAAVIEKTIVVEARKSYPNSVGAIDGTEWLTLSVVEQARYIRALGDFLDFQKYVSVASQVALEGERKARALDYENDNKPFTVHSDVTEGFRSRVKGVIGSRPFGDLVSAITKFYQRKPLLKDKAVIWVLAVPLYKEVRESQPKTQPGGVEEGAAQAEEKIVVTMTKKK